MTDTETPIGVCVARSPVHGNGLFALRKFLRSERIIEYTGERITAREYARRYPTGFAMYGLELGGRPRIFIDAADPKLSNEARYANDARKTGLQNNAYFGTVGVARRGHVQKRRRRSYLYAARDILPGEEILVDYGKDYWR